MAIVVYETIELTDEEKKAWARDINRYAESQHQWFKFAINDPPMKGVYLDKDGNWTPYSDGRKFKHRLK